MRVLVSGAGGLLGTALSERLRGEGIAVGRLVRRAPAGPDEVRWDPGGGGADPAALAGWDAVVHRPGDIVVSTSAKAGTTWMQRIVSLLIFGTGPLPDFLSRVSPWIDCRYTEPLDDVVARIDAQEHRRFLKTHLPVDALPFREDVRYIVVGRDTRDVFMSLWNHYRNYTDEMYAATSAGDPPGGPLPRCPDDLRPDDKVLRLAGGVAA